MATIVIIPAKRGGKSPYVQDEQAIRDGFSTLNENVVVLATRPDSDVIAAESIPVDADIILILENEFFQRLPVSTIRNHKAKKVMWTCCGHIEEMVSAQKKFIELAGVELMLNASHLNVDKFKVEGKVKSVWLPMGINPSTFQLAGTQQKQYLITYCGLSNNTDLLTWLEATFGLVSFPPAQTNEEFLGSVGSGYINIVLSAQDIISPDVFRTIASGAVCFVNRVPGMETLFTEHKEIVFFNSKEDLQYKLFYYKHNQEPTMAMIDEGKRRLLSSHTYAHRANTILHLCAPPAPKAAATATNNEGSVDSPENQEVAAVEETPEQPESKTSGNNSDSDNSEN